MVTKMVSKIKKIQKQKQKNYLKLEKIHRAGPLPPGIL